MFTKARWQAYPTRLIFDLDQGTYSIFLNDSAILTDRPHGVSTGRGVGSISLGFLNNALAGSALIMDDLQVGVSDAELIPAQLEFLVEPTRGVVAQPLTPALEVAAVTVFDQLVPDGTLIEVGIASGPAGATLSGGTLEPTFAGSARFVTGQSRPLFSRTVHRL